MDERNLTGIHDKEVESWGVPLALVPIATHPPVKSPGIKVNPPVQDKGVDTMNNKTCAAIKQARKAGRKDVSSICARCAVKAVACPYRPKEGR